MISIIGGAGTEDCIATCLGPPGNCEEARGMYFGGCAAKCDRSFFEEMISQFRFVECTLDEVDDGQSQAFELTCSQICFFSSTVLALYCSSIIIYVVSKHSEMISIIGGAGNDNCMDKCPEERPKDCGQVNDMYFVGCAAECDRSYMEEMISTQLNFECSLEDDG